MDVLQAGQGTLIGWHDPDETPNLQAVLDIPGLPDGRWDLDAVLACWPRVMQERGWMHVEPSVALLVAELLDGRALAARLEDQLRGEVAEFTLRSGLVTCLAAVIVGDDPASQVYVRVTSETSSASVVAAGSRCSRLATPTRPHPRCLLRTYT